MNSSGTAILVICAVLAVVFAFMIVRTNTEAGKKLQNEMKNSWGRKTPQLFSAERLQKIRAYSDSLDAVDGECGRIDDITARDLDLDRVYSTVNHSLSSAGDEVLYAMLRHPALNRAELLRREKLITLFMENETIRDQMRLVLSGTGRLKGTSFYEAIDSLEGAKKIGKASYLTLSLMTAASFILLFFKPLAAIAVMVPVFFLDFRIHLKMKEKTLPCLRGFQGILRLLASAEAITKLSLAELETENCELRNGLRAFESFRRASHLAMAELHAGTGIGDAILEYLNMFFHFNLICFDRMLDTAAGHREDAIALLRKIGDLDAAQAAASWRSSLKQYCIPEFLKESEKEVYILDMVHPLLEYPTANSIEISSNVLLTGSNASGKSTFLKNTALSAVLAQSINTVTAAAYRAPLFRIFSSMALSDSLISGESYFVVEIRSLKRICDAAAEAGEPVLCMIDEVLRGTNTVERIAASAQILKTLSEANALVFAATHDIELSYMLEDCFRNYHFGEIIENGDVCFDYRLREGRSEGTNALRLLSELGFGKEIAEAAGRSADYFKTSGEWKL